VYGDAIAIKSASAPQGDSGVSESGDNVSSNNGRKWLDFNFKDNNEHSKLEIEL